MKWLHGSWTHTESLTRYIPEGRRLLLKVLFSPPDISEREIEAVAEVLRSGWITTGPKTKEFERRIAAYTHTDRAICFNSATAAMEMALRILGIGEGDEVITSAYTYTATASAIHHVGARIVLVDTAPGQYEMDYGKVAEAITEKTKAILPVDIGGKMIDYDQLFAAVNSRKHLYSPKTQLQKCFDRIVVIADSAHGFGSAYRGKPSGTVADFTAFSFHAVKNLTTAEGGALVWCSKEGLDDEELYRQLNLLALHGQSKDALSKLKPGAWEYDITSLAYKNNMTDIMAAIGLVQLDRYDAMVSRRRQIAQTYDAALIPLGISTRHHFEEGYFSNCHLLLSRIPNCDSHRRNRIIQYMAERGIACNVHYKPLPMFSAYRKLGFDISDYPMAYAQFENEITLPLHSLLTDEEVSYVINVFQTALDVVK